MEFRQLTEPFLLISEIERHIRGMLKGKIPVEDLQEVAIQTNPKRKVKSVSDLTLGDYSRIIEKPGNWEKLALRNIDRRIFSKELSEIRTIRNKVMHFNEDGATMDVDTEHLRRFAGFVLSLDKAGSRA